MTTSNQPQQADIAQTMEVPSPQKVSTKVPIPEERLQTIKETVHKNSKRYPDAAAVKKVDLSDVSKKDCNKDTRVSSLLVIKSWLLQNMSIAREYINTRFPAWGFFCEEKVKIFFALLMHLYSSISISYNNWIKPNRANIQIIHSVCMIFWGGSWYSLALFLSFVNVYPVVKNVKKILDFPYDRFELNFDLLEKHIVNSAHEIWVMFVIFYSVWTIPVVASLTISFATLKLVAQTMIDVQVTKFFERNLSLLEKCGRFPRYVMSVLLISLLPTNIQACLLTSCWGCHKLSSVLSDGFKENVSSIKGPNNIDGIILTSWICVAISIVLQLFGDFQSSLFGFLVPLGFCIPKVSAKVCKQE